MRNASICLLAGLLVLPGCEKPKEVTVTEKRSVTTADTAPKLFATSDERFRDTKASPVKAVTPDGWRSLAGSQMRQLDYRFGPSGQGEAYVTIISGGTVVDNVNRWLKQFGAAPLDPVEVAKLKPVMMAGGEGVWVEAEGTYEGAMGAAPKEGFALSGVVALVDGKIVTVKMVGPKAEVAAAKEALEGLVATVRLAE